MLAAFHQSIPAVILAKYPKLLIKQMRFVIVMKFPKFLLVNSLKEDKKYDFGFSNCMDVIL